MRKTFKSLMLASICLFGGISNLTAQANMTLWNVNQAHIDDPNDGFANFWDCGYEYYITYTGPESSKEFIIEIKNEGNQALNLTLPLSLSAASANEFTIVSQPAKSNLQANEETHFLVRYTAPATYNSANANLTIQSDDPDNPTCDVSFQVGFFGPRYEILCGTTVVSTGADVDLGAANVGDCTGQTITKTFTIRNNYTSDATVQSGCGNSDLVTITGADAADFSVVTQPSSTIADWGGTTTFVISFTPSSLGVKTAAVCFDVSYIFGLGGGTVFNLLGTGVNCLVSISYESNNRLTFGDPCNCNDLQNCTDNGVTYFHDILTMPATGTYASGLDFRIVSADNFFIDVPCGGTLTTPTPSTGIGTGTQITEVGTSGVYQLEFWRPSGAQAALSVSQDGNPTVAAPVATFQPICTVEACTPVRPVPTMSQWGLMIFGGLILNIFILILYKKEEMLKF